MTSNRLDVEVQRKVHALKAEGRSYRQIGKALEMSCSSVSKYANRPLPAVVNSDKRHGELNWREVNPWIKRGQEIKKKASSSQDEAVITLGDGKSPIILATLSDMHIGSWAADHEALERITDELLETPNLYVALLGDYMEYAVSLRSVLETCSQILPPEMQSQYIESWLDEIWPRVAWATFDNHNVARSEKAVGESSVKRIFSKKVIYHSGIGHVDVTVGNEVYKIASSHRFRGSSMLNPAHACMRYLRMEGQDREICMMGDTHVPMAAKYREGQRTRVVINTGNLHAGSGYAKRWFSLAEHPYFPCLILYPDRHEAIPLWSVKEAIQLLGASK